MEQVPAMIYYTVASVATVLSGVWFMSKRLNDLKSLIYQRTEQLKDIFEKKLEYHEQHDDRRFEQIRNDLWEIRVANAARYGLRPAKRAAEEENGNSHLK